MKSQHIQQQEQIKQIKCQLIPCIKKNKFNIYQFLSTHSLSRLNLIRLQLSKNSIKSSIVRVYNQKQFQQQHDLISTQQLFDQKVSQNINYYEYSSEYAESSTLNKGKFSKNGEYYGTVGSTGEGYVWGSKYEDGNEKQFMKKITSLKAQVKMCDIAFHPKMGHIPAFAPNICTSSFNGQLYFWTFDSKLQHQKSIKIKAHSDRINSIQYHKSCPYLLCSSYDQSYSFYDCVKLQRIFIQKGHQKQIHCSTLHPDGGLYFTGDLAGCGMVWDLRMNKAVYQIKQSDSILCCDFNPNGYQLAVAGKSNMITIKDIRRLKTLRHIPAHTKLISGIKYAQNQSILTSVSHDNHLKLWHGRSYVPVNLQSMIHGSKLTSVDIKNNMIATTVMERKWVMWMLKKGNEGVDVVKREDVSQRDEEEEQSQQGINGIENINNNKNNKNKNNNNNNNDNDEEEDIF